VNVKHPSTKISFCTTCRGEKYLALLKETLPQNLETFRDDPNIEIIILAYGDQGVFDWVKNEYEELIQSGRIVLAHTEQEAFRMAHAKNMAHRLGTGEILVNVDADNVLSENFNHWLRETHQQDPDFIARINYKEFNAYKKKHNLKLRGFGGRIALSQSNFKELHGYSEEKNAWGGDDDEFFKRMEWSLNSVVNLPEEHYGDVLQHCNQQRYGNMSEKDKKLSRQNLGEDKPQDPISRIERKVMRRLFDKKLHFQPGANPEGNFGCGELTLLNRELKEEQITLSPAPHKEWEKRIWNPEFGPRESGKIYINNHEIVSTR
jgi:hypothetical protein